jgi:outer membrane lipoprotein-sorting protein
MLARIFWRRWSHAVSLVLFAVIAAFAGTAAAAGFAEPKVEYTADSYITANDGRQVMFKIHQAPGKQRMDFEEGGKQSIILRPDKKVSWILMPEEKMYLEMSLEEGTAKSSAGSRDIKECKVTAKPSGKETVNGVETTRSNVEMTCPDGFSYTGKMWVSKDGILVKMDATGKDKSGTKANIKTELKNLKVGKLAAGTFDIPSGHKRMKIPGMGDIGDMLGTTSPKPRSRPPKP